MPNYLTLTVQRPRPGVVLATLSRPSRLNAITSEMFEEFHILCAEVAADERAQVFVLTGEGRGSCARLDREEAARLLGNSAVQMMAGQQR